jgi:hypothetical protein
MMPPWLLQRLAGASTRHDSRAASYWVAITCPDTFQIQTVANATLSWLVLVLEQEPGY